MLAMLSGTNKYFEDVHRGEVRKDWVNIALKILGKITIESRTGKKFPPVHEW